MSIFSLQSFTNKSFDTIKNNSVFMSTDRSISNNFSSNAVYSHDFLRNAFLFITSNWDDIFIVLCTLCVLFLFISHYTVQDTDHNIQTTTQTIIYNGKNKFSSKSSKINKSRLIFQPTQTIAPDTTYFQYSN